MQRVRVATLQLAVELSLLVGTTKIVSASSTARARVPAAVSLISATKTRSNVNLMRIAPVVHSARRKRAAHTKMYVSPNAAKHVNDVEDVIVVEYDLGKWITLNHNHILSNALLE